MLVIVHLTKYKWCKYIAYSILDLSLLLFHLTSKNSLTLLAHKTKLLILRPLKLRNKCQLLLGFLLTSILR